jgi:hypothetical protein
LALPFWWSDQYGYHLFAECGRGATLDIDTTRTGTGVMWSFAPLLNLSPTRGFREDSQREAAHILLQLQPLLEKCVPNKPLEPTPKDGAAQRRR